MEKLNGGIDNKSIRDKRIIELEVKIIELERERDLLKETMRKEYDKGYIQGLKDGTEKYNVMLNQGAVLFYSDVIEEYKSKIDRLQSALDISEKHYLDLYRYLEACSKGIIVNNIDISRFERPIQLYQEDLGLVLTDEKIRDILYDYYVLNLHVEEIALKHYLNRTKVEQIVLTYDAKYIDGVVQYVKKETKE